MLNGNLNSWLIKIFYALVLLLTTTLTGYRLKIWIKDYLSLSSKFYISSILTQRDQNTLMPTISICNINPARGSQLLRKDYKTGEPQDYELFVDTLNGRINRDVLDKRLMQPYFQILDRASHKLPSMLKHCSIGKRKCSYLNFTKSLLPTGACYTYNGELTESEDISLILDTEIHEYLIPNSGFAGFRVLIHSYRDPLWVAIQNSLLIGPKFHTFVRVNQMEKRFKMHCVDQNYWILCMHQCLEKSIFQYCQCYLMGSNACTLRDLMGCGMNIDKLTESLKPEKCSCTKRCNQVTYRLESITQSVKNNIFSAFLPPWTANNRNRQFFKDKKIQTGQAIQFWAYLREANISAFEDLRKLSVYLDKLLYFLKEIEETFKVVKVKLENQDIKKCFSGNKYEIYKSGIEFINFMKQKEIIRNLEMTPLHIIHIHLVNLLFRDYGGKQLKQIENFTELSHFIADLSLLDSSIAKSECKEMINHNSESNAKSNYKLKESFLYLEKILMKFNSNFKIFKKKFLDTVRYNKVIINRISNLSSSLLESEYRKKTVAVTMQVLKPGNFGYQLESAQNMYDPHLAILDIVISGLLISFVFILLASKCLKLKDAACSFKATNLEEKREETIRNNLSSSQAVSQKEWLNQQRGSLHSRDMDSPVTTFHLI